MSSYVAQLKWLTLFVLSGSSLNLNAMLIGAVTAQLARSSIARWHILPSLTFISKVTEVFSELVAPPIIQCVGVNDLFVAIFF
jgi:hypothetical protein